MPADDAQRPLDGRVADRHDANSPGTLAVDALVEPHLGNAIKSESKLESDCHVPNSDSGPAGFAWRATDPLRRWCKVLNVANQLLHGRPRLRWRRWRHRANWNHEITNVAGTERAVF